VSEGLNARATQGSNLYFVGVTTEQSSIMKLFPVWAAKLGLDATLLGRDLAMNASPDEYRACIDAIVEDTNSAGALITTHKAAVYDYARGRFAELDEFAEICREISCVARDGSRLKGYAKDPITAGLAMEHMFETAGPAAGREVVCFGAGGAGLAIVVRLLTLQAPPAKVVVIDRDPGRIDLSREVHRQLGTSVALEYHVHAAPLDNDAILATSPSGTFVVNATGLGKDLPGSPLSPAAVFPHQALVWDLNYRGALEFLAAAWQQADSRGIEVHDGWRYFLHGWTEVISEVFSIAMTPDRFAELAAVAEATRSDETWRTIRGGGRTA
jgi:shikimate dehydrogenase